MRADLEAKMRQLLAKASVVAEAPAQNIGAEKTSHGKAGSTILSSRDRSLHDRFADRFRGATTDREAERAIAWAKGQLRRESQPAKRELTADQRNYWIIVNTQGRGYRDVALEFGINEKIVWKLRKEAGYDPRYGYPKGHEKAA